VAVKKRRKKRNKANIHVIVFVVIIAALFITYFLTKLPSNPVLKSDIIDRSLFQEESVQHEDVLSALIYSAQILKVPDKYFRHKEKEGKFYYYIGISKNELDLNFANSIITGHVEKSGGKIISGTENTSGNNQYLDILDTENDLYYVVNLYYRNYNITKSDKTLLAIIVDDFGYYNEKLLDDFCQLDSNITFSILPGLPHSTDIMFQAEASGHETMIHMPMEPINYPKNNPGPDAIYVHMKEHEIRRKMEFYFSQLPLCAGANNHMGSLVTADKDVMIIVLTELKEQGLYFVDSRTTQSSVAYSLAQEMMIPALENNLFLDTPEVSDQTMKTKIEQLKKMSKNRDQITVITHCNNRKQFEYLQEFLVKIKDLDFELVPASRLLKREIPDIL